MKKKEKKRFTELFVKELMNERGVAWEKNEKNEVDKQK